MIAHRLDEAPSGRRAAWVDAGALALLFVGAATLLRAAQFDNPIAGLDEQFYLLAGDRLLDGALPYVDIWDRKPFGLFALFAAIRLLGGNGVLAAQLVGALFVAATATVVALIAWPRTGKTAAILAGLFYIAILPLLWGATTQTPVFYNLPIALAAWAALKTGPALDTPRDRWLAIAAMLLCGVAIQIKTNALFEGVAIGLWLVIRMARRRTLGRTAWSALLLAAIALVPTAGVMIGYTAVGHFDAWWFANVASILLKRGTTGMTAIEHARESFALIMPVAATALLGLVRAGRDARAALLGAWLAAAALDAVAIGGYWPHYFLPFALPASVLAAHAFDRRFGCLLAAAALAFPIVFATLLSVPAARRDRDIAGKAIAAIPRDAPRRCMLIYEGPVIYYHLARACLVTRYAFPDHLRSSAEAGALPDDAGAALRAALAHRPGTILTVQHSDWPQRNRQNDAILAHALTRSYRPIARLPHRAATEGHEWLILWRRADLPRDVVR